jgi:hypothetical protein
MLSYLNFNRGGVMKKSLSISSVIILMAMGILVNGCASMGAMMKTYKYDENTIDYWSLKASVDKETMMNSATVSLVEKGFDIKFSNEGAGLLTTEWKKGSELESDGVSFDIYLQIKTTFQKLPGGTLSVKLSPLMKVQNRLNSGAYTEMGLQYLSGDQESLKRIAMHSAYDETFQKFMEYANDIATAGQLTADDYKRQETSLPKTYNPMASFSAAVAEGM